MRSWTMPSNRGTTGIGVSRGRVGSFRGVDVSCSPAAITASAAWPA
jgi:hypothetical protein